MIVTTSYDSAGTGVGTAKAFAEKLKGHFVERKKRSIARLHEDCGTETVVVVTGQGPKVYRHGMATPFQFHPDTSYLRIKRMIHGEYDSMGRICGLKRGDRFLDCTLGFASDAIVASYIVGESGSVIGLESERVLSVLVEDGLERFQTKHRSINEAMRRVHVKHTDHHSYLKHCEDHQFDVIYFDPMFRRPVHQSKSIVPMRPYVNPAALRSDVIQEAYRVAKRCVVLKERSGSEEFERLGFEQQFRANASTSYGVMNKHGKT